MGKVVFYSVLVFINLCFAFDAAYDLAKEFSLWDLFPLAASSTVVLFMFGLLVVELLYDTFLSGLFKVETSNQKDEQPF